MVALSPQDTERFWSRIDKENSSVYYNGTRCWEWTAGCDSSGYGQMKVKGRSLLVHRISYEISIGEISQGLQILHRCDNRRCCNPDHLFPGTNQDNVDDMNRKGRHADVKGEANPSCKLSDAQVAEIRRRYQPFGLGVDNISTLSKEFQVSRRQVRRILIGKSWS